MKFIKLTLSVSIIFFLTVGNCFSQSIDTSQIVTSTKIFFMYESNYSYSKESAIKFLNEDNFEVLQAKGFEDLIFVKLMLRGNFQDLREKEIPDSSYIKNRVPFSCDYVIAVDLKDNDFFRIKGFEKNDFAALVGRKYKPKEKEDFIRSHSLEEVDLECLFEALIIGNGKGDCPCMKSCKERDKQFSKIKVN